MPRQPFRFEDLAAECRVEHQTLRLDDGAERYLGARVFVPEALRTRYPYNASAYAFLQELRHDIKALGVIEFPDLPLNPTNHTLAQRDPSEHSYSANSYLTGRCQQPHQDTPPFPTAFWLDEPRVLSATWLLSRAGVDAYFAFARQHPGLDEMALHRALVPALAATHQGVLVNQRPGLILIDNSDACGIFHARTCNVEALDASQGSVRRDTPMYAFNEVGLLQYIDTLDERRGSHDRDAADLAAVRAFLAQRGDA